VSSGSLAGFQRLSRMYAAAFRSCLLQIKAAGALQGLPASCIGSACRPRDLAIAARSRYSGAA